MARPGKRIALTLLLLLTFVGPTFAQGFVSWRLTYSDGEVVELSAGAGEDIGATLNALLDGNRDGKLEMFVNGKLDASLTRVGEQVELTDSDGGNLTVTLEEARAQWAEKSAEAKAIGRLAACQSMLRNLGTALEMWSTDHDGKFPDSLEALAPDYLVDIPVCPASQTVYAYKLLPEPLWFEIQCTGDHSAAGCSAGYPAFDGAHGLLESEEHRQPVDPAER